MTRRRFVAAGAGVAGAAMMGPSLLSGMFPGSAMATVYPPCTHPAQITFDASQIISSNASPADQTALINLIKGLWNRYLSCDVPGTTAYLTGDVTRMSNRWGAGHVQQGSSQIASELPVEWVAYERPAGIIYEEWTIKQAEIWIDASGTSGTLLYWPDCITGYRWGGLDVGLIMQGISKVGGTWKVSHSAEAFSMTYDLANHLPGVECFHYDWAQPVVNMSRATTFYNGLFGVTPESTTATTASWLLRHCRFKLDLNKCDGLCVIKTTNPQLPCGWGIIYENDVTAKRDYLKTQGVTFLKGTGTTLLTDELGDKYAIGQDKPTATKNPFVIKQRYWNTAGPAPGAPSGLDGGDPGIVTAKQIANAWLHKDTATINSLYVATGGRWLDTTRVHHRGLEVGAGVSSALTSVYWPRYDAGASGVSANVAASSVSVRSVGARKIVSYEMTFTTTGTHRFVETAFVQHVMDANSKPLLTMIVESDHPGALPRNGTCLDYSCVPSTALATTEDFYETTMGWQIPTPTRATTASGTKPARSTG